MDIPPGLLPEVPDIEDVAKKAYDGFFLKMSTDNIKEHENAQKKEKTHQKLLNEISKIEPAGHF
eukprot:675895-Karenia_brevis.AAC.1